MDWILEQKKDISEKIGGIQVNSTVLVSSNVSVFTS